MAAPLSKCTVVGEQSMTLCLFSEDVKNLKFIGEADDSLKVCCPGGFFHSMITRVHIPRQLPLKQRGG